MTVLQVIPEVDAGGAERTTLDIARALVEAGHKALIATQGGRLVPEIEDAGGVVFHLPVASKSPIDLISNIFKLKKIIEEQKISLVHARSRAPAWSAFFAAKQCNIPFVTTYHGTYSAKSYFKRLYNSIMVRGIRVIANSEFIAGHIRDTYGLSVESIVTIPRGLDVDYFDPEAVRQEDMDELRASWDISDDDAAIILLPGRLTSWKGQSILIEAAHKLREKNYNKFVCVLMGDVQGRTAYESALRKSIEDHNLHDLVKIVEHCNNMPAAYQLADVVISASTRPEAFGRIAIEAQAMKRPVIVTDHGGAQETVVEGETGWRVPPDDAHALTGAIMHVLQMKDEELAVLGDGARQRVLQKYSVDIMCQNTLNLYSTLLGSKIGVD